MSEVVKKAVGATMTVGAVAGQKSRVPAARHTATGGERTILSGSIRHHANDRHDSVASGGIERRRYVAIAPTARAADMRSSQACLRSAFI